MLNLLHDADIVVHIPQNVSGTQSPQWLALRAAWKHPLRKSCDWALVCDVDEFINIHVGDHHIADLIAAVPPETEGIVLPWRLFGNNGRVAYEDLPTTEQFTRSMPGENAYPIAATFFKSLIRTDGRFNQFGVHRPKQKPAEKAGVPCWVNGSGAVLPPHFSGNMNRISMFDLPNGRDLVECNHYSLRAAENFIVKTVRGLPNRAHKNIDLAYWVERNFNTEENTSIAAMRAATLRAQSAFAGIPGLMELHAAGVRWHRERFQDLMRDEAAHRLYGQILVAGDSTCLPERSARQIIGWYQEIYKNRGR